MLVKFSLDILIVMDNQPVANALYFAEINEGVVTNPTETDYLIYPTKSSNPIIKNDQQVQGLSIQA